MRDGFIFRRYKKLVNVKLRGKSIASDIKPEWEELCSKCSSMAKAIGWTKEDSRELLKKVRNEEKTGTMY